MDPRIEHHRFLTRRHFFSRAGGSLGIAALTTMLARREASNRAALVEHISPLNPAAMTRVNALTGFFQRFGASVHDAQHRAFAVIDQIIDGQAALKAFDNLFTYVGIAFLITLPLVFFLGRGGNKAAAAEVH